MTLYLKPAASETKPCISSMAHSQRRLRLRKYFAQTRCEHTSYTRRHVLIHHIFKRLNCAAEKFLKRLHIVQCAAAPVAAVTAQATQAQLNTSRSCFKVKALILSLWWRPLLWLTEYVHRFLTVLPHFYPQFEYCRRPTHPTVWFSTLWTDCSMWCFHFISFTMCPHADISLHQVYATFTLSLHYWCFCWFQL